MCLWAKNIHSYTSSENCEMCRLFFFNDIYFFPGLNSLVFRFPCFCLFFRFISRIEGVVGRGWVTSLFLLFRTRYQVLSDAKVPAGLAGRSWVCDSYHKLQPLPTGLCALAGWLLSRTFFPLSISLWFSLSCAVFTRCSVFLLLLFPQFALFRCLTHRLREGGGHDSLFLLFI